MPSPAEVIILDSSSDDDHPGSAAGEYRIGRDAAAEDTAPLALNSHGAARPAVPQTHHGVPSVVEVIDLTAISDDEPIILDDEPGTCFSSSTDPILIDSDGDDDSDAPQSAPEPVAARRMPKYNFLTDLSLKQINELNEHLFNMQRHEQVKEVRIRTRDNPSEPLPFTEDVLDDESFANGLEASVNAQRNFESTLNDQVSNLPTAEQPEHVVTKLLPHQLQALFWECKQEDEGKGGLICDQMGLGKTIEMVSLIAARPSPQKSCGTLIVVPAVGLMHWKDEIKKHTGDFLSVVIYHATYGTKKLSTDEIRATDVVVTSYATLLHSVSLLNTVWYRIILDEAHNIKNSNLQLAKVLFKMKARTYWGLTGTPVQNKISDLYSLFKFIRISFFFFSFLLFLFLFFSFIMFFLYYFQFIINYY